MKNTRQLFWGIAALLGLIAMLVWVVPWLPLLGESTGPEDIEWTLTNGTDMAVITYQTRLRGPVIGVGESHPLWMGLSGLNRRYQIRAYEFIKDVWGPESLYESGEYILGFRGQLLFCHEIGSIEQLIGTNGTSLTISQDYPPGIFHSDPEFDLETFRACPDQRDIN